MSGESGSANDSSWVSQNLRPLSILKPQFSVTKLYEVL